MKVKVGVCQYSPLLGKKDENLRLSLEWIDKAGQAGADLIVLPELVTTGYAAGERMLELAESIPGPVTEAWGERARTYGAYIIAGLCRRDPNIAGVIYNSAVLVGPRGEVEGVYSKVVVPLYLHTWCDERSEPILVEEAELFRRGDDLPVFKTALGTIGIQVCQDAVYPEFTRVQVLKGAQIIVQILNGPPVATQHEPDITPLTTRVHAFDNGVYIVLANRCGEETFTYKGSTMTVRFHGESHIADPFGSFVAKAQPEVPELIVAEIDTDNVRRAQWGGKFLRDWRPELLAPLCHRGVTLGS